jgi:hypothetical protein
MTSFRIICDSTLTAESGENYDLTDQLSVHDPQDTVVGTSNPHWVSQKPSITSQFFAEVEPVEGDFACVADYWVYSSYIGQGRGTTSFPYPTGEENDPNSPWSTTAFTAVDWKVTLLPNNGSFYGRPAWEQAGPTGNDTCFYPDSGRTEFNTIDPSPGWMFPISANNRYQDTVGWLPDAVGFYRSHGRVGCQTTIYQDMIMYPAKKWISNTLVMGITETTVWSRRADKEREIVY